MTENTVRIAPDDTYPDQNVEIGKTIVAIDYDLDRDARIYVFSDGSMMAHWCELIVGEDGACRALQTSQMTYPPGDNDD